MDSSQRAGSVLKVDMTSSIQSDDGVEGTGEGKGWGKLSLLHPISLKKDLNQSFPSQMLPDPAICFLAQDSSICSLL